MTDKERIAQLEARVAQLEAKLSVLVALVGARQPPVLYHPQWLLPSTPWPSHYEVWCGTNTHKESGQ